MRLLKDLEDHDFYRLGPQGNLLLVGYQPAVLEPLEMQLLQEIRKEKSIKIEQPASQKIVS